MSSVGLACEGFCGQCAMLASCPADFMKRFYEVLTEDIYPLGVVNLTTDQ